MELIRTKLQQPNNPNGLQFIILSHDGLLEKYFDRLGGNRRLAPQQTSRIAADGDEKTKPPSGDARRGHAPQLRDMGAGEDHASTRVEIKPLVQAGATAN